ncbi:MAG TPA: hypothetical protein VIW25_14830 [Nitrososphaeraceae archaeon]
MWGFRPFNVGLISIQKTSVWSVFIIEIHVNNHLVIVTAVYVIPEKVREANINDYNSKWNTSAPVFSNSSLQ